MSPQGRTYRYVGPADLKAMVRPANAGRSIRTPTDFHNWASEQELTEPFTFVIDTEGILRLAPRRSEHVACAGGAPVLSAGEMTFVHEEGRWFVTEVSNQSTGYCPDTNSWPAVAEALEQVGLGHPPGFTHEVIFRRCPACQEHNIVREDDFVCVFCDSDLPRNWNIDASSTNDLAP
ncbi:hypothetical protein [Actinomadura rubrisoli]|uniref:Uncharacterized protein n=1 Tax=Actinomadura rubrisoli TaxID=2530368 RepID=A0A4R4ZWT7_9ACTN|nr:hypothetical protein [Actinomadura rubrisoli]TDD61632.1 hypothetical protein E1298_45270 [Actinomadura rubrisoli]